ncbi:4-hydroxy-tetrahydrodipicolinate reductase [soil metagenome]
MSSQPDPNHDRAPRATPAHDPRARDEGALIDAAPAHGAARDPRAARVALRPQDGVAPRGGAPAPIALTVVGARGRMGMRIIALARLDPRFRIARALSRADTLAAAPRAGPHASGNSGRLLIDTRPPVESGSSDSDRRNIADVVVDFSSDSGVIAAIAEARRSRAALLIGTTGLSTSTLELLRNTARERAVCICSNTSVGAAAVDRVLRELVRALGPGTRIEMTETHHLHKKDAPSGTARRLAATIRAAGAALRDEEIISIREGEVIGTHAVTLFGAGEEIEVIHRATTRDLFALGALRLAAWLAPRAPGMYLIDDMLGAEAASVEPAQSPPPPPRSL